MLPAEDQPVHSMMATKTCGFPRGVLLLFIQRNVLFCGPDSSIEALVV
jgi:hypothetical protein